MDRLDSERSRIDQILGSGGMQVSYNGGGFNGGGSGGYNGGSSSQGSQGNGGASYSFNQSGMISSFDSQRLETLWVNFQELKTTQDEHKI